MKELNIYPDFITIDGSEGGSGATYKSMADYMGLPLIPALLTFIDTANHYGVRNKFKVFASGKLITPDKVAIVLKDWGGCCKFSPRIYDGKRLYYGPSM